MRKINIAFVLECSSCSLTGRSSCLAEMFPQPPNEEQIKALEQAVVANAVLFSVYVAALRICLVSLLDDLN